MADDGDGGDSDDCISRPATLISSTLLPLLPPFPLLVFTSLGRLLVPGAGFISDDGNVADSECECARQGLCLLYVYALEQALSGPGLGPGPGPVGGGGRW